MGEIDPMEAADLGWKAARKRYGQDSFGGDPSKRALSQVAFTEGWAAAMDTLKGTPVPVEADAQSAWKRYRDGELWHRNRRQLRKRDFLAGWEASRAPRVSPTVDQLAQFIRAVDGAHTMGAGDLAERILTLFASQPTVAEVREQATQECLDAVRRLAMWR